jgi:Type II CAAX prenyl endopeptidase Rce1-like
MESKKLNHQKRNSGQQITVIIFLILLLARLFIPLEQLIWHIALPSWYSYGYYFSAYMLASVMIWINRNDLRPLNIDKPFLLIFIFSGIILSLYYLPTILGICTGLTTFFNFTLYREEYFKFSIVPKNYVQVSAIIVIALLPFLVIYSWRLFSMGFRESESIWSILFSADLVGVTIEEVTFRSLLWMFLVKSNQSVVRIILLQAILFWIAHLEYISLPITFWFWTPWVSIWLGIIVWRSKSIAPSTLTHFIFNLLIALIH